MADVWITDMLGRNIERFTDQVVNSGINRFVLGEKEKLPNGVYTIHLKLDEHLYSQKLVVR
jgi:hypothetical protein